MDDNSSTSGMDDSSLTSGLDDNSLTSGMDDLQLQDEDKNASLQATINDLINRCKTLHSEVETYVAAVDSNQKLAKVQNPVEYRSLRSDFKNELAFLNKLTRSGLSEEKARHWIVSSNLVYFEALWSAAKRSTGLLSFRKYFFWNRLQEGHSTRGLSHSKGSQTKGKSAALVDIVAADGTEWIRVSTISQKRLLFDLAKMGWQNDSDSDDDEEMRDADDTNWEDDDDDDQVDTVKNARELARAARANPIRGRPPKVRFVLTRIESGKMKEIDAVIAKVRATGAIVQCANELTPALPLADVLPQLLVDRSRTLSHTLNVDCTILLALISDISHKECPILDWYPGEVRAQIKQEQAEKLLPTHLYPAIGSHPMVCTQEAAHQMNLIVDTLATDTEKTRANLLLAQNEHSNTSPADLVSAWAALSNHPIPEGFQLPIRVYSSTEEDLFQKLPSIAPRIAAELGPLNSAIFLYGWAQGLTTLSSNRARSRQIDSIINECGLEDGEAGPHVWLCGESRSLIAKHGRRK
ncbi:hypothetical protein BU24DRAFT_426540 [Aaosphaeria arxii CBS 175.79]|uniref:DUF1308 domain-containing protein n=1 Tax=Aaosphaeria arxii CBS 175.79 TaxID=1450172 RepID=A0A6A5XF33_9PLEO|nr:uncharacterized protein BU24DRAFT_426540 [Aaosphaeria arxii CBS 175.79]KAF2011456.1 hypothetical protein BU24DRAFT_426540 [Aaosphaeria arxii CBS 175.79]